MTTPTTDQIRAAVAAAYGGRARAVAAGLSASCCEDGAAVATDARVGGVRDAFYTAEQIGALPEAVVSYGCGNPVAIAGLSAGEVVLDLGSGAGLDCFLAAQQVGPAGRVIGLDMTDDMLALAERNRERLGVDNVVFRQGTMEAIPLDDASVDVVISNCVINLSPDKDAVFRAIARVLRPGGRLHVSDVVLQHELSAAEQADLDLWAGCIAGALLTDDYARRLTAAGLVDVSIEWQPTAEQAGKPWQSALISARRPNGATVAKPWLRPDAERLTLLAPAGLETAACCGPDGCAQ